ncbi:FCPA [Symbiodinium sp. CCMP2592]|nr:FCPA [Symbiodinium sp. CCMP2592]
MGRLASWAWSLLAVQFALLRGEEACSDSEQIAGASLLSAKVTRGRVGDLSSELNESMTEMLRDTLQRDANDTSGFPDAEANSSHENQHHGLGGLSKPFEFLYAKVAELETAVQLQNLEIKALSEKLEEKSQQVAALSATVEFHSQLPDHGHGHNPEKLATKVSKAKADERAKHKKHRHQVAQLQKDESVKLLRAVLGKHVHQHRHGFAKPVPGANASEAAVAPRDARQSSASGEGASGDLELDKSVTSKDPFGALSDAYNAAADQVSFVANTVIDTVEAAMAILLQGFDLSAGCPQSSAPSAGADENGVKIHFGRQRCEMTLVGQTVQLFDFDFGERSFPWFGPLATLAKLGFAIADCATESGATALVCFAKAFGKTLLEVVPPFSMLTKLNQIMEEFIALFALMAGKLIEKALGDSTSLIQEAVQAKFPEVGAAAVVKKYSKNLELRLSSRHGPKKHAAAKHSELSADPSLLQRQGRRDALHSRGEGDDKPEGALGFGASDYVPQVHKLITQFNGVETDSGSCLAFAPSVRGGPGNTVLPRDWQTPGQQSDSVPEEFIKLEPWAVPCTNEWMKDNPSKWEGYSFYTWESPVERCATVVYSLSLQPVIAFVGGLEFDIMPAPIAEVETLVCWPETQPGGVDLSAIEMHIKSGGVPLLTRTLRLKKRFGSGTDFSGENIKATTASGKLNFGVPEDGADDSGLNAMSRESLLEANVSRSRPPGSRPSEGFAGFEVEQTGFLASMVYDMLSGPNVTGSWHGAEAAERLQALFPKDSTTGTSFVESQQDEHVLFSLTSPNSGLVGFETYGLLSDNKLQLGVQLQFGPFSTSRKTYTILDLKAQLAAILAAIPFISPASKATAVQAMSDFDSLAATVVPTSPLAFSRLAEYWIFAGGHRPAERGKALFWDNGPQTYPFNEDSSKVWRLLSDGLGEYWLVTGDHQNPSGNMLYLKDNQFQLHAFWEVGGTHIHNFNYDGRCRWLLKPASNGEFWLITGSEADNPNAMLYLKGGSFWVHSPAWNDPSCTWRAVSAGDGGFWLVTAENHHDPNQMLYISDGQWKSTGFWKDPKTKFRFLLNG